MCGKGGGKTTFTEGTVRHCGNSPGWLRKALSKQGWGASKVMVLGVWPGSEGQATSGAVGVGAST